MKRKTQPCHWFPVDLGFFIFLKPSSSNFRIFDSFILDLLTSRSTATQPENDLAGKSTKVIQEEEFIRINGYSINLYLGLENNLLT